MQGGPVAQPVSYAGGGGFDSRPCSQQEVL